MTLRQYYYFFSRLKFNATMFKDTEIKKSANFKYNTEISELA